jgi:DNA-binding HxlR family transcriptional regulator
MDCCSDKSPKIIYKDKEFLCSLAFSLSLIGDKYKSLILYHLRDGKQRSGELQSHIQGISNRMFTHSIRALEKDDLVKRTVHPTVPPRVDYELTETGLSIIPIILDLNTWGKNLAKEKNLYK